MVCWFTQPHIHKISTELNYILEGELIASGQHLKTGDIWVYEKDEESNVEFLTDVQIIVVRWPSIPTGQLSPNIAKFIICVYLLEC